MRTPLGPDFRPFFHELHRVGRPGIWRSIVGAILLGVLAFVLGPAVVTAAVMVTLLAAGSSIDEAMAHLDVLTEVTPVGLLVLNLSLAASIPAAWFVSWLMHRLKPRWLSSVGPFLRWKYFTVCLGLSVIALVVSVGLSLVVPQPDGAPAVGQFNEFTTQTQAFILVIALFTPLQAAGEEYVFRGYLTQAFGSVVPHRVAAAAVAVLGPAVLFALAHGSQSVPVFFDRFAFGVVAGILVLRTGGLEAAIAMHVLNNFVAFGLALAFGDISQALSADIPSNWWMIVSTLGQSLTYLFLADWAARRMRLARQGPPLGGAPARGELEPATGPV